MVAVTTCSPLGSLDPSQLSDASHEVALVDDQVKVISLSTYTVEELAEILAVGAGGVIGTGAGSTVSPPPPPPPPQATMDTRAKKLNNVFFF